MQEPQETQVRSLGQEDPLEEEMATHSTGLVRIIPWTEEPRGLQPMGVTRESSRAEHTCSNFLFLFQSSIKILVHWI